MNQLDRRSTEVSAAGISGDATVRTVLSSYRVGPDTNESTGFRKKA